MSVTMRVVSTPDKALVYTNHVYVSSSSPSSLITPKNKQKSAFIIIKHLIFTVQVHGGIQASDIGISSMQRDVLSVSLNDEIAIKSFNPPSDGSLNLLSLKLTLELIKGKYATLSEKISSELIISKFENQILTKGQYFAIDIMGTPCKITVQVCETPAPKSSSDSTDSITQFSDLGLLLDSTVIEIEALGQSKNFTWEKNASSKKSKLFDPSWNFSDMGIGGLDEQFNMIFRRAFASRMFSPKIVAEMGINHVKGMLLYGPPGTGKTLIARQIGKMLTAREPKIVNGPEILNKFVGASEENIRKLFIDAENDQRDNKESADLHIIIFDEIDAICKVRGRSGDSGTGVGDTVVNQLLTKIDGVDALNNILVIGMTNRKDMIDPALLRPGRFEVHIEISLPDEKGRIQILNIHTKKMREMKRLHENVNIQTLASTTKNFSGAEIEGLVKSAASFALYSTIDITKGGQSEIKQRSQKLNDQLLISMNHFELALDEVKPAFGVDEDELNSYLQGSLYDYGKIYQNLIKTAQTFINNVRIKKEMRFDSLLLHGQSSTGKTSIAASLALNSDFAYVKIISPKQFLGLTESKKINDIIKIFEDAYKSTSALIIVDSIERLIEFVNIGPRFSAPLVQCLVTLCSTPPPNSNHHLVVLGTTSENQVLNTLGFKDVFTHVQVPQLTEPEQIKLIFKQMNIQIQGGEAELDLISLRCVFPIGIKQLLAVIHNMPSGPATADKFTTSLQARGIQSSARNQPRQDLSYLTQDNDDD